MAADGGAQKRGSLAPAAVATLKTESARDDALRANMERTLSEDIREEREDLKRAAEQSLNAIIELDLRGIIRWASPSWVDITGEPAEMIVRRPITDLLVENCTVFKDTVEAIMKDDSKSRTIRFAIKGRVAVGQEGPNSGDDRTPVEPKPGFQGKDELPGPSDDEQDKRRTSKIDLEAQGIMVYDRTTGLESHTMWMIKPAVSREITIDLPDVLIESLGIGAEMLANYLTLLADEGVRDPENHPPPMPVLCRICERQITPWWFEKHTELCSQEHRAEMEVQLAQESLNEQRSALVKVLDALEAQTKVVKSSADAGSPLPMPKAEYKGLPIGSQAQLPSAPSSGRASPASNPTRSRESSTSGLSHHRARSFAVRRPLARIVELVLDLCDTAMEISTPSIKDTKSYAPGELRTQSPQSESRIQQVLQWQSPSASTLENENGLSLLCDETSQLAKAKTEAVFRHRRILEYSERIRVEYDILVQECIEAALQKAARITAGELSDSSEEDSSRYETPEQGVEPDARSMKAVPESILSEHSFDMEPRRHSGSPSAMAFALRHVQDFGLRRRTSSNGSSRASSPHAGAMTPKSSYSGVPDSFALHKRGSLALESDTGADSDTSMRSSIASSSHRSSDSPSADVTLGRVVGGRSRDRKRQSLVLPSLTSAGRHASPARGPPPPPSPLRMAKPRLPSVTDSNSIPSPITSPVTSQGDFYSPVIRAQHHRRQSSNALGDALGRPASPRLSAVISNPQPRAVQTSIKDFEIIKPISKGAFGSVYLSKKKSTGDYYAIKTLKKADMIAKNQVTNVKAERAIMMWQGESDFVAKLYWTFSSKDYLYLVMEYLNGGDCASLIKVLGSLPEDWTKKYIGEVVLCVQHLHSRQIVHRDLKPDNLLIDAKGHLKLTDFGLSRMGLIGRQKRAINAKPEDAPPDLLKSGPFRRAPSVGSSRSTSFDYHAQGQSPAQTPSMLPAVLSDLMQPSYFSLNRESSREPSRRASGNRSNSGDSEGLESMFRRFSVADGRTPIEEETASEGGGESPDPYALQPVPSNSSAARVETPPQTAVMPPPMMSLFDPQDSDRRFVGTPDYLAPETISGAGQDEMSDWWSIGCILFECLYGIPPFHADTPEEVFQHILNRRIQWPDEDEDVVVSEEARDLIDKLLCVNPNERLGSNRDEEFPNGGEEIKAYPWFADTNWDRLREDEASFVPASDNPEDTEYFDARGATMGNFAAEFQDEASSPAQTPGMDYPDRPHDALSRIRTQVNAVKRNLMPLHIPPHVRDARSRRLSEPVATDDFGSFQFKNLPVLEKANKDVIQKLRADAFQAHAKSSSVSTSASSSPAPALVSPPTSLESSPLVTLPLSRALSITKGNTRPQSPLLLSQQSSSPNRGSQPSSPLLVSFSAGQHHERRNTSSGSSSLSQQGMSLQPGNFFDPAARLPASFKPPTSNAPSPVKSAKSMAPPPSTSTPNSQAAEKSRQSSASSPRQRSYTVGSQEGELVPDLVPSHHKRRSGVFDVSPSSSDNEETRQKALLRVQRRRQSSRRMSQINFMDGPTFRTLDVLVCEDHPVSRLVMERLLEKLRCRTIAVNNGSEAMRYAMSEVKFDIIMMEYKLPQVNGADVARMIRTTKNANAHTPMVAVTGYLKELLGAHHFDALVEKPPTKEKLEQVMGRLCQWKAPPDGWKPTPQPIPQSNLRQGSMHTDESPTTSSGFGGYGRGLSSSYHGSREDSVSTSLSDETNNSQFDTIPVIISRQATNEWDQSDLERNFGGLGISNTLSASPEPDFGRVVDQHRPPGLTHQESAPATLGTQEHSGPRKQPSMEAIQAKRQSLERGRHESAAESGDDEDEELGNINFRQRSPRRHAKRTSKLGTEMMRTNSQGSVVSNDDLVISTSAPAGLSDPIRHVPETILESSGTLTPPEIFPREPGHHAKIIDMDADIAPTDLDTTPKPHHGQDLPDPDPTPRASGSPMHRD